MPTDIIEQILKGEYLDPDGGQPISVPIRNVVIADTLDGMESDLVRGIGFGGTLAVVCDPDTKEVLGDRVRNALSAVGTVLAINLPKRPHADMDTVESLTLAAEGADALVAVGSGTINDLCKFTAARTNRPYAVFGTAPSMNGYTSVNAAITVGGMKKTLAATAPTGVFLDLKVLAGAPKRMILSGLGDSVCRPTAQADWLLAHLLKGDTYREAPFAILAADEEALLANPEALTRGDIAAMSHLARTLVLSGFGMTLCGDSRPASQAEHLISHYGDMLAPRDWPECFHGEQIAVATLTMARLQERMLSGPAPRVKPSTMTEADILAHFGPAIGPACWKEIQPRLLDAASADAMNAKLESIWPAICERIAAISKPAAFILDILRRAGAPTTPEDINWPSDFYRDAVRHAREIRNRYTFLDLAADSGVLENMIKGNAV